MTDRRHPSDGEPGHASDEIRVGSNNGFPGILADLFFIHPVRTAGQHQDELVARLSLKDERFDDLTKLATYPIGCFLSSPRGFGKLDHFVI